MNILFVHSNYPAQFKHLINHLKNKHNTIKFLAANREWTSTDENPVELIRFEPARDAGGELCHPYLKRFEKAIVVAQAAVKEALKLRQEGFNPDLIVGHSGFGATLFLKEIWKEAKFIGYFEWFYRSSGSDVGFIKNDAITPDYACRVHTFNAPISLDLSVCDAAVSPTKWQAQQFPKKLQNSIDIIFEGVDTKDLSPLTGEKERGLKLDFLPTIPSDVPLVTYTTRGFEPYRGWPQVAEGISLLQKRNPRVHILLVGSDEVAYGSKRPDNMTWRQWAFQEFEYDATRLHFSPPLSYEKYIKVLQNSWVHIYWTIPFILSWSLIEAMSCGCSIVASNTEPVREVITSGIEGILVDFYDSQGLADRVDELVRDNELRSSFSERARQKIVNSKYDKQSSLQKYDALIERVLNG